MRDVTRMHDVTRFRFQFVFARNNPREGFFLSFRGVHNNGYFVSNERASKTGLTFKVPF